MALFGSTNSFIGIDIGTSSLKLVELVSRRKRIEVTAYAQTVFPNPLITQAGGGESVQHAADVIKRMLDKAGTSSDTAVVALPASAVFSTVVRLPAVPEGEMEKAVEIAARDVVPADLDELVLGYSRVGEQPHMKTGSAPAVKALNTEAGELVETVNNTHPSAGDEKTPIPVFITAAPKYLVDRYVSVLGRAQLKLLALELETFPLVRSLLTGETPSGMIVDIGDRATTFHIIDAGTPRVSYTSEIGGHTITLAIARVTKAPVKAAEAIKGQHGLRASGDAATRTAIEQVVNQQIEKAKGVLGAYERQGGRKISQAVLIGGGANLPGLNEYWQKHTGQKTTVGNPWRGLSYPDELEQKLRYLGPTYGVAVGLALRGFQS